jgi:hypothetical protein
LFLHLPQARLCHCNPESRGAGADRQQRGFIEKRNASFGKRGYDLRQAMEDRLEKLNTIARQ